jgi:hypothetical protein
VIDSGWRDARGRPLVRGAVKSLVVGPADRLSPVSDAWRLHAPPAGTRDSLRIEFGEPLDRALLMRLLSVVDSSGVAVRGAGTVTDRERGWMFVPDAPWTRGSYFVQIDTDLEDLAGNSLKKLFDMGPGDVARTEADFVRRGFRVQE